MTGGRKKWHLGVLAGLAGVLVLFLVSPALASEAGGHGVAWKDYLFKIINFAILIFLLIKFLRNPLREFLEKRHNEVKEELKKAKELSAAAEKTYREAQQRLAHMDKEIQAIRERMLKEIEQEKAHLLKEAEEKAEAMRIQAEQELREEMEQMKKKLREEIATEALALAEKLVHENINEDDQKKLVDFYIRQIGSMN